MCDYKDKMHTVASLVTHIYGTTIAVAALHFKSMCFYANFVQDWIDTQHKRYALSVFYCQTSELYLQKRHFTI